MDHTHLDNQISIPPRKLCSRRILTPCSLFVFVSEGVNQKSFRWLFAAVSQPKDSGSTSDAALYLEINFLELRFWIINLYKRAEKIPRYVKEVKDKVISNFMYNLFLE